MHVKLKKSYTSILFILLALLSVNFWFFTAFSFAQTANVNSNTKDINQEKKELQNRLAKIQQEIKKYESSLQTIRGKKNTLQNKIKKLNAEKSSLRLQIEATNIKLDDLNAQAENIKSSIVLNTAKIKNLKSQMGRLINLINRQDNHSLIYILFSQQTLSEVFSELKYDEQLLKSLTELLSETKILKTNLEQKQDKLTQAQEEMINLQSIRQLQQNSLKSAVNEQKSLLSQTKGKESAYQTNLSKAKNIANEIRGRLYTLLGTDKQIDFGEAVEIAEWTNKQTGVRAAFLLAILTQESNLGKNVGTCNRASDPPEKSYKVVMHPTRDQPVFLKITAALGRNPETTPISCPMHDKNGNQIGWGGAMGPAQFIPSTWSGYSGKVEAITGQTADPWDIRDAFLASGIKLAHDGATSIDGEWAAAMRYFSGGTNPRYSFYGDSVIALAKKYQSDINELNKWLIKQKNNFKNLSTEKNFLYRLYSKIIL